MSTYFFENIKSNKGLVQVSLGWDNIMQWFFIFIGKDIDDIDALYFDSVEMLDPDELTLSKIESILKEFDISDINIEKDSKLYINLMEESYSNNFRQ